MMEEQGRIPAEKIDLRGYFFMGGLLAAFGVFSVVRIFLISAASWGNWHGPSSSFLYGIVVVLLGNAILLSTLWIVTIRQNGDKDMAILLWIVNMAALVILSFFAYGAAMQDSRFTEFFGIKQGQVSLVTEQASKDFDQPVQVEGAKFYGLDGFNSYSFVALNINNPRTGTHQRLYLADISRTLPYDPIIDARVKDLLNEKMVTIVPATSVKDYVDSAQVSENNLLVHAYLDGRLIDTNLLLGK